MLIERSESAGRVSKMAGIAVAAAVLSAAGVANVRADMTYGFGAITANGKLGPEIGEAQMFVTVSEFARNQVLFYFVNAGPEDSSITAVYFDDGTLLGIALLIDADDGKGGDPNVDFSQGASPPDLPGGNNVDPPFEVTAGFLADSDAPTQSNGVNPEEFLGIVFELLKGGTIKNVFEELDSGELRIGIHVQGFADGTSEGFINNAVPVPVPGAVVLGALGLGLVGWAKRRVGPREPADIDDSQECSGRR